MLATGAPAQEAEGGVVGLRFGEDAELRALARSAFLPGSLRLGRVAIGGRAFLRAGSGDPEAHALLLESAASLALHERWSVGLGWRYGADAERSGHAAALLLRHRF